MFRLIGATINGTLILDAPCNVNVECYGPGSSYRVLDGAIQEGGS